MRSLEETLSSSGIRVLARRSAYMRQHYARFAMAALIREHPRFDGVVALNDDMMLGAIDAMREAGIKPSKKVLVSLGYVPEARRLIEAGDLSATFDPRFDLQTAGRWRSWSITSAAEPRLRRRSSSSRGRWGSWPVHRS